MNTCACFQIVAQSKTRTWYKTVCTVLLNVYDLGIKGVELSVCYAGVLERIFLHELSLELTITLHI